LLSVAKVDFTSGCALCNPLEIAGVLVRITIIIIVVVVIVDIHRE